MEIFIQPDTFNHWLAYILPILIFVSGGTGAILFGMLAEKKDSMILVAVTIILSIATFATSIGVSIAGFKGDPDTAWSNRLNGIAHAIDETYNLGPNLWLANDLTSGIDTNTLQVGKGEGIVWRGNEVEFLIDGEARTLQWAWVDGEWLILDLTDPDAPDLTELEPVTDDTIDNN